MPQRDLEKEKIALKAFGSQYSKMPDFKNQNELADFYKLAYPPGEGGLPEELKGTIDENLYLSNSATMQSPVQPPEGTTSNINDLYRDLKKSKEQIDGPLSGVNRNEFGRLLQDSIRRSSGYTRDGVSLGESPLFKEAGITGYNALSSSLTSYKDQMINSTADLSRVVNDITGLYKSQAADAFEGYKMKLDEYQRESDRLSVLARDAEEHKRQIELMYLQNELSKSLKTYGEKPTTGKVPDTGDTYTDTVNELKAIMDKTGSLSEDELIIQAGNLLEVTTGRDRSDIDLAEIKQKAAELRQAVDGNIPLPADNNPGSDFAVGQSVTPPSGISGSSLALWGEKNKVEAITIINSNKERINELNNYINSLGDNITTKDKANKKQAEKEIKKKERQINQLKAGFRIFD